GAPQRAVGLQAVPGNTRCRTNVRLARDDRGSGADYSGALIVPLLGGRREQCEYTGKRNRRPTMQCPAARTAWRRPGMFFGYVAIHGGRPQAVARPAQRRDRPRAATLPAPAPHAKLAASRRRESWRRRIQPTWRR